MPQPSRDPELISHVFRRLGMGANADLVAETASVEAAIERCLADPVPPVELDITMPTDWDQAYEDEFAPVPLVSRWWINRMIESASPIHERLTWFWHDHFAMTSDKADVGWMLWRHLNGLRQHAMGNFGDLLRDVSHSSAMLVYLDGELNNVDNLNENFGREVLELYTLGVGNYSQDDVVAAARACTGFRPNFPLDEAGDGFDYPEVEGWASMFFEDEADLDPKTLLGQTGAFGMDDALQVMLEHPATGRRVANKLYQELVGLEPSPDTETRLGDLFATDYEIMPLVEAIIAEPAFTSAEAVRAKVRTPLEKLVTVLQSFPPEEQLDIWGFYSVLAESAYGPFRAPNPAGYRKGPVLLAPGTLASSFVFLDMIDDYPPELDTAALFARLGVYDISDRTARVVAAAPQEQQLALAYGAPEFMLT